MNNIETFKLTMLDGMKINFENDGFISPLLFFYHTNNKPIIMPIESDFLSNYETKSKLAFLIRKICENPLILAAGIIIDAFAVIIPDDNKIADLVKSGNIKVSELKEKENIILMLFSTPIKEELFVYKVNCNNKTINNDEIINTEGFSGIFSSFFDWKKN